MEPLNAHARPVGVQTSFGVLQIRLEHDPKTGNTEYQAYDAAKDAWVEILQHPCAEELAAGITRMVRGWIAQQEKKRRGW